MRWRRLLGWSIIIFLILIVILGVLVFVYLGPVRSAEGRRYAAMIHEAAKPLRAESIILAKQTDKLIEQEPTESLEATKAAVQSVQLRISSLRAEVKKFEATAQQFNTGVALPTSVDYRNAVVIHTRVMANVAQFNQTLDEYDRLLVFLLKLKELEQPLSDTLARFNAQMDLNLLAGTDSTLLGTATALRHQGSLINTLSTPPGMEEVRTRLAAVHVNAAAGFEALARGLSPPIDAAIYGAAGQIESATRDYEDTHSLLEITLEKHPVLKDARDLPEKVSDL